MGEKDRNLERAKSWAPRARKDSTPPKPEPSRGEEPDSDADSDADLVSSDHVRVVIRCRPLNAVKERDGRDKIRLDTQANTVELRQDGSMPKTYRFSFVADDRRDNAFIFVRTGRPIVECALAGFNGAIVAYGQTGSGKTFTMQGTSLLGSSQRDGGTKGLTQSVCETLFEQVHELTSGSDSVEVSITASYLEIYNEVLLDLLLAPENGGVGGSNRTPQKAPKLTIREDSSGQIFVNGLSQVSVATPEECYQLLVRGAERRTVGATNMNAESSRSHSVFTLMLEKKDSAKGLVRASRLHLVDLAGSERQRGTGATGVRLREAGGINKSLSALGNVINALSAREPGAGGQFSGARGARMPSCRDSKLTFLLKDALGGNAKLCLIATISPAAESVDETVSTLEFARRCAAVRNEAVVNESLTEDVAQLQAEVRRLKAEVGTLKERLAEARASAELMRHRYSGSSPMAGTPSASSDRARSSWGVGTPSASSEKARSSWGMGTPRTPSASGEKPPTKERATPTATPTATPKATPKATPTAMRTGSGQWAAQAATQQKEGAMEEGGQTAEQTARAGERGVPSGPAGVISGAKGAAESEVVTRDDMSWMRGKAAGTEAVTAVESSPTRVLDFGQDESVAEVAEVAEVAKQVHKESTVSRGVAAWECGGVVMVGDPVSDEEDGRGEDGERVEMGGDEGSVLLRELREGLIELNRFADELLAATGAC